MKLSFRIKITPEINLVKRVPNHDAPNTHHTRKFSVIFQQIHNQSHLGGGPFESVHQNCSEAYRWTDSIKKWVLTE